MPLGHLSAARGSQRRTKVIHKSPKRDPSLKRLDPGIIFKYLVVAISRPGAPFHCHPLFGDCLLQSFFLKLHCCHILTCPIHFAFYTVPCLHGSLLSPLYRHPCGIERYSFGCMVLWFAFWAPIVSLVCTFGSCLNKVPCFHLPFSWLASIPTDLFSW